MRRKMIEEIGAQWAAASLGCIAALLFWYRAGLAHWKLRTGRSSCDAPIFPGQHGNMTRYLGGYIMLIKTGQRVLLMVFYCSGKIQDTCCDYVYFFAF
jgi:hypothetical protein